MAAAKSSRRPAASHDPEEEYPTPNLSVFEFTAEDLRANQRGYLSDRQRGWLQSTARGIVGCSMASAPIALGFVLLGLSLILALYLQNEETRAALFSNPANLLMLAAAAVVAVSAIGLSIWLARRQASSVERARLQTVQGRIRFDQDYSPSSAIMSYHVFVGDHKFSFTEAMDGVFREGETCRVYFCKSGPYQLIMSFEHMAA